MMPLLREDGAARCASSRVRYTVLLHGICCCEQEKNSSYSMCSGFLYTARQSLDAEIILAARCAAWASICRGGYELETDGRAQHLQFPLMRGEIRELLPHFPQLNLALFRLIRYTKIVVLHSF